MTKEKENLAKEDPIKKKTEKKKKIKKRATHTFLIIIMVLGIAVASTVLAFGLYIVFTAPEFTVDKLYSREASAIYAKDGTLITRFGEENRVLKSYEEFPQVLVDALVATEDSRFFQHNGFDAGRFLKASLGQMAGNSDAGGASTITMQLVKQNFTSSEASGIEGIIRKFTDIYMAIFKIEKNYTKQQIIEFYFNSMWLANGGTNFGSINGVEQACQYYFGKSVSDITLNEAAIIVGMYNNPTYFNPQTNPEATTERRSTVLSLMVRHGYITEQEKIDAEKIPVESLLRSDIGADNAQNPYQHLIDFVVDDIKNKTGIDIYKGGYSVKTTFDLKVQGVVNAVEDGAAWQFKDDKVQVGIAVTSSVDGSIVALGPGRAYVASGLNRSIMKKQPGSTAKPIFDYGPLIEYNNASPQQMFLDYAYTYNNGTNINNWDNGYYGIMTMKNALAESRNVPALQAFQQVDPKNIAEFVHNLGIDYGENLNEAYSIGGMEYGFTPLEASAAYAAFARGGYYIEPYSFTEITNIETEETITWKYEKKRAMSEETAYMITDILLQATASGVGGNINSNLRSSVASKSGTSNVDEAGAKANNISVYATPDHWVNTYSPDYSISLWMGYDKLDSEHYFTSSTGGTPRTLMSAYLANNLYNPESKFTKPSGITTVTIESQLLPPKKASANTPSNMKISAMFKAGTEPSETSTRFTQLQDPTNVQSSNNNGTITITWNGIGTPDTINQSKIKADFQKAYSSFATNYPNSYNKFLNRYLGIYNSYNANNIGDIGYQVYLKQGNGLRDLGWTRNNSFTYRTASSGTYEFVIKSSYSIYKGCQSNGVSTKQTVRGASSVPPAVVEEGLTATANDVCVEIGKTLNPKSAVTVNFNGTNVTNDATISFSSFDTQKEGNFEVTYSVNYKDNQTKVTGNVEVKESCEAGLD